MPLEKVGKCKYNQIVTIFKRKTFCFQLHTENVCNKKKVFSVLFFLQKSSKIL